MEQEGMGGDESLLTPLQRVLQTVGLVQLAEPESSVLTVAVAAKRLHLCLLCVATAFPGAAGGPLLAGI